MNRPKYLILLIILIILTTHLFGCKSSSIESTPDITGGNFILTAVAQTVEVQLTSDASSNELTPTLFVLDSTITPSSPLTETPSRTVASNQRCNQAKFVKDVTIPDGQEFAPLESFTKTWRLRNTGSCSWTQEYMLVFDKGDALGGPPTQPLATTSIIPPSGEIDISVDLIAPEKSGEYRGNWKLRSSSGDVFGLGDEGSGSFWVEIIVLAPPSFSLSFDNIHSCDSEDHVIFRLFNKGSDNIESAEITMLENETENIIFGPFAHSGPFMGNPDECPHGADKVSPGKAAYIGASLGGSTEIGQEIRVNVRICTKDNMDGACSEESTIFTIP